MIITWTVFVLAFAVLDEVLGAPAHDAQLADKATCIAFIDGIEAELEAWGVL